MSEKIVSPGVFQRETDQSFITPAPVEVGAAIKINLEQHSSQGLIT
jgi:hypothetical protein